VGGRIHCRWRASFIEKVIPCALDRFPFPDTARNEVTVDTRALPADIERLLIVGQADGVADFSGVGRVSAAVRA